jgi:hypothetical protein
MIHNLGRCLLGLFGGSFIAFSFIATEEAWGLLMSGIIAIAFVVGEIQLKREKAMWAKHRRLNEGG